MNKNPYFHNGEGYFDGTAGAALERVAHDEHMKERGNSMAKKRNCRRTPDENKIHEKAVKMRKMTDDQLVDYVENRVAKAHSEGFNKGKRQASKNRTFKTEEVLAEIGDIKGIGAARLQTIREIIDKHLEVCVGD